MRALCLFLCLMASQTSAQDGFDAVTPAIDAGAWDEAAELAAPLGDVAAALVDWNRLREGAGTFGDYAGFVRDHGDWPGMERLRREGERAIPDDADPEDVVAFVTTPLTGEGAARLAEALMARGRTEEAEAMLVEVWLTLGLDEAGFEALRPAYAGLLAPHDAARADMLLWRWRTTDAERLLPLLDEDTQALLTARAAFLEGDGAAPALLEDVAEALQDDPGLANARFTRLAEGGDYTDATALLLAHSDSVETLGQPFRWASWRASLARWHLREGRGAMAFDLATLHHLTSEGRDARFFADLEWLAGYTALRRLQDPARALTHFEAMEPAVSTAISVSRMHYWRAQALRALARDAEADAALLAAAAHQTAFYGLLASDALGLSYDPALAGRESFADWRQAAWLQDDIAHAALLLLEGGDRGAAFLFISQLARELDREGLGQLGDMLTDLEEPFLTVLVGKTALARGIVLPAHAFPLHPLAVMDLPVAPELALAIARRESEFNAGVGSPVGALGLMQLMPGTAQEVSGGLGLTYARGRLTADWQYNATLGSAYLAQLIEQFGNSPVLVAAGYNAGPGRPRTWMTQRGDPRRGEVDVVDWIEMIPFTETRTYVMRVTESLPIYRMRLGGPGGQVRFVELLEGSLPLIRPLSRPDDDGVPPGRPVLRP